MGECVRPVVSMVGRYVCLHAEGTSSRPASHLPVAALVLLVGVVGAAPLVPHAHHAPVKRDRQLKGVFSPHFIYRPVVVVVVAVVGVVVRVVVINVTVVVVVDDGAVDIFTCSPQSRQ